MTCRALDWDLSAADVLRLVRDDAYPVALLGAWADGSDVVASEPAAVCAAPTPVSAALDAPLPGSGRPAERSPGVRFGAGWIGYLGFGAADTFLPVPPAPGEPRRLPAWWFGYYDHVLRRDRATGRWFFEALDTPGRSDVLEHRFRELSRRARAGHPKEPRYSCGTFRQIPSAAEHRAAVQQAIEYIRRGDIFQANICLRMEASFDGDPLDAFCRAVTRLDPPYAGFLRIPGGAVASLSPELFLRRTGTTVLSQPIKGTRPRSPDQEGARRQRDVLTRSAKDRAENVMIVDLMRNDLSRVCVPGSVEVPALLRAEAHPGVWHLVSDVRGTLRSRAGDGPLVAAAFPPGSVTGAPKIRAVEVIHELEAVPREVYTGAIGYRSPLAGLELNVAIRTFEFSRGRVWLGSGGGITARSDPAAEYRECLLKATPLIKALGATLADGPGTPAPGDPVIPQALRPRPARGVFTSLRITDGRGHDLDAHIARLTASARELSGKDLPPGMRAELAACLAGRPSGRLRMTAWQSGGPWQTMIEVVPEDAALETIALHPVTIPGGLGAHKWSDRRLLTQFRAQAGLGPDEHLLIQDANGDVLETDRASVFAVIDGVLHTPPADGRLLPGITRAAVLRLAAENAIPARAIPLSRQLLLQAGEVFATNSVHGILPVRSLGGTQAAWPAGPITARLRDALARSTARAWDADHASSAPASLRWQQAARHGHDGAGGPAIILLDNYDSFTYNLAHLLLRSGCRVEVVRNDEVAAQDIANFRPGGIVISPGPGGPADAGISIETVRVCGPVTPLLGICLGHQAIAAASGGRITRAPQPVHGQACPVTHDGHGVLAGLPQHFAAARYHSLIIDEDSLPSVLQVTARGPGGIPMGLRHSQHPVEGLQFHPESILTTHGATIISNFVRAARGRG